MDGEKAVASDGDNMSTLEKRNRPHDIFSMGRRSAAATVVVAAVTAMVPSVVGGGGGFAHSSRLYKLRVEDWQLSPVDVTRWQEGIADR